MEDAFGGREAAIVVSTCMLRLKMTCARTAVTINSISIVTSMINYEAVSTNLNTFSPVQLVMQGADAAGILKDEMLSGATEETLAFIYNPFGSRTT